MGKNKQRQGAIGWNGLIGFDELGSIGVLRLRCASLRMTIFLGALAL
jgi:hypothetical protein